MSTIQSNAPELSLKPTSVKALPIIIIVKALLALVFFIVFTVQDITVGSVGPQIILYTFLAFCVLAIPIFYFYRKKQLMPLRIAIVVDLLAALPATAFISIVLSLLAFGLTFTRSARSYFNS